jgi:HPt (histidine-containing phosphotransfer) domain-containing protein
VSNMNAWGRPGDSGRADGPGIGAAVGAGVVSEDGSGQGLANGPLDGSGGEPAVIDRVFLSRCTQGNEALAREVLQLFAHHVPHYVQQLRTAQSCQSWLEAAHTIKGSALAVGACRLARLAALAQHIDIAAEARGSGSRRDSAVAAVAAATEDACRVIAGMIGKA